MLMPTTELRTLLAGHGLADEIEALARFAHVEIALVRDDGSTATRLGGGPDVPAGFEWPCRRRGVGADGPAADL